MNNNGLLCGGWSLQTDDLVVTDTNIFYLIYTGMFVSKTLNTT